MGPIAVCLPRSRRFFNELAEAARDLIHLFALEHRHWIAQA